MTHDVEEAVYLADRVIVLAPGPGRIDSLWRIDLPARTQELKLHPDFLRLRRQITDRIRATSGLAGDLLAPHALKA